jgi:hypothetical protein
MHLDRLTRQRDARVAHCKVGAVWSGHSHPGKGEIDDVSAQQIGVARIDRDELRRFISEKYSEVADDPELGFTLTPVDR